MQRQFVLRPSRLLAFLLSVTHIAALVALLPLTLPLWAKLALASMVLFSLHYHVRHHARLASPASAAMLVLGNAHVSLALRDGNKLEGTISGDSLVTPWLTVLNFLPQDSRFAHSVVILPDSLDAESFRQLRVWLKWGNA